MLTKAVDGTMLTKAVDGTMLTKAADGTMLTKAVDGTILHKKQSSHSFELFVFQNNLSDELMTHLDKLIFVPNFLQAA